MDKDKIAIVTGAGSGIGKSVAIALCDDGWTVVLTGRREQKLKQVATECKTENTYIIASDETDQASVKNLFDQTIKSFGRVDLLFNNAGISAPSKPMEELSLTEWQNVINTNLTGVFLCTQEAIKIMKSQKPMGGRIINNGSISAQVPRPFSAPYTASKHAVTGLTRSTSLDCRKYNIACGQIDIGNASSQMTQKIEKGILQADGSMKIEPTINVQDVSRTVLYMASLPLDTNVPFVTIMANEMPYIGRG